MSSDPGEALDSAGRKRLRGMAMHLKPTVIVGRSGPTASVIDTLESAFHRNPLVKIRLQAPDRATRTAWLVSLAGATHATICGTVGQTASLYRSSQSEP